MTVPIKPTRMIPVRDMRGNRYEIPEDKWESLSTLGLEKLSAEQVAIDDYVKQNTASKLASTTSAIGVALDQAVDEFALGIPEAYKQATQGNSLEMKKWNALKEEFPLANAIGGTLGAAGSLLYGGPIGKGAAAATGLASRVVSKLLTEKIGVPVAKKIAPVIASKTAQNMAQAGIESAVYSAPEVAIQSLFGDNPEQAAEKLRMGVLGSVGVVGLLGGTLGRVSRAGVQRVGNAVRTPAITDAADMTVKNSEYISNRIKELSDAAMDLPQYSGADRATFEMLYDIQRRSGDNSKVFQDALKNNMLSKQAFEDFRSARQKAIDTEIVVDESRLDILKASRDNKLPSEKSVQVVNDLLQSNPEFLKEISDIAKNSKTLRQFEKNVGRSLSYALSGGVAGSIMTGGISPLLLGAAVSTIFNRPLAKGIRSAATPLFNPFNRLKWSTDVLNTVNSIDKQADLFSSVGSRAVSGLTLAEYESVRDALFDPMLPEQISQAYAPVADIMPDAAAAATTKTLDTLEYLKAALPKQLAKDPFAPTMDVPPNDTDVAKFSRILRAIENPSIVLYKLRMGTLTKDEVEAVKQIYPEYTAQMIERMMEWSAQQKYIPHQMRLKMNWMINNNPSQQNVMMYQNQFAPKEEGQGSNVNVRPDSIAPMTDTIQMRR